jgi:uncharacterized protein (TIGR00251 family)
MSRAWCSAIAGGVRIAVHIMPNAKKTEVAGLHDDALKLRLHAPPIEGRANEALVRYVADCLDLPKTAVELVHGHTSRKKVLEVHAPVTVEAVTRVFLATTAT